MASLLRGLAALGADVSRSLQGPHLPSCEACFSPSPGSGLEVEELVGEDRVRPSPSTNVLFEQTSPLTGGRFFVVVPIAVQVKRVASGVHGFLPFTEIAMSPRILIARHPSGLAHPGHRSTQTHASSGSS